jgi:formylglycine-generating enzyme required for sulfatase activity
MAVVTLAAVLLSGCGDDEGVKPDSEPYSPPDYFVTIPSDTFQMGWGSGHEVILARSYFMASTEVTNGQYAELAQWAFDGGYCTADARAITDALDGSTIRLADLSMDDGVSFAADTFAVTPGREEFPVRYVSWYGAAAYCDWLSLREGRSRAYDHSSWLCNGGTPYDARGFRLPTEAEWECACRAGTLTPFNTGDCLDSATEANYNGTQPAAGCPAGPYVGSIVAVGSYLPNGFGLYDMHGNLWEWCNDWYADYSGEDEKDPVGPGTGTYRIVRGGSWSYPAMQCASYMRSWNPPDDTIWLLGLRPVITVR